MNSGDLDHQTDEAPSLPRAAEPVEGAWSIRKLLDLIDEAIDSAGAQLARSAGLWNDGPPIIEERHRSAVRRDPRAESTRDVLEGTGAGEGIGLV